MYGQWAAIVVANGGTPTTLPTNVPAAMQPWAGQPAARYDAATYVALYNAGAIDSSSPQVASNNNAYVYVVAPPLVVSTAPQTMTAAQAAENALFTGMDAAANTLGLPSETEIIGFLKEVAVGFVVTLGAAYVLKKIL